LSATPHIKPSLHFAAPVQALTTTLSALTTLITIPHIIPSLHFAAPVQALTKEQELELAISLAEKQAVRKQRARLPPFILLRVTSRPGCARFPPCNLRSFTISLDSCRVFKRLCAPWD